jgi:hypothetical protein
LNILHKLDALTDDFCNTSEHKAFLKAKNALQKDQTAFDQTLLFERIYYDICENESNSLRRSQLIEKLYQQNISVLSNQTAMQYLLAKKGFLSLKNCSMAYLKQRINDSLGILDIE